MRGIGSVRVNGGILNRQMLTGSQRYFKLDNANFDQTISDGTVEIKTGHGATKVTIAKGDPVPDSAAEQALRKIQQRATIVTCGVNSYITVVLENLSNGWEVENLYGSRTVEQKAAAAMEEAIRAMGVVETPTGDVDLSEVTVVEVPIGNLLSGDGGDGTVVGDYVVSFNGRIGRVSPQATDYSKFYATTEQGALADTALQSLRDDTNPVLAGTLQVNDNVFITPNRFVFLATNGFSINDQYDLPMEDGTEDQVLVTDGDGNVTFKAVPPGSYTNLTDIPNTFPPSAHGHLEEQISDLDKYSQSEVDALLTEKIDVTEIGKAGGVADLDGAAKVPMSRMPDALLGSISYQGVWDALNNVPDLVNRAPVKGEYYVVNVAGFTDLNGFDEWNMGDWALHNGEFWEKLDNSDQVSTVAGKTGTVLLYEADILDLDKYSTSEVDGLIDELKDSSIDTYISINIDNPNNDEIITPVEFGNKYNIEKDNGIILLPDIALAQDGSFVRITKNEGVKNIEIRSFDGIQNIKVADILKTEIFMENTDSFDMVVGDRLWNITVNGFGASDIPTSESYWTYTPNLPSALTGGRYYFDETGTITLPSYNSPLVRLGSAFTIASAIGAEVTVLLASGENYREIVNGTVVTSGGQYTLAPNNEVKFIYNGTDWDLISTIGSFTKLNDGAGVFTGKAGKTLRVNTMETTLEYVDFPELSPLREKGDLYVYTTNNSRLPLGTSGQVLSVDTNEPSGVRWTNPQSGVVGKGYLDGGTFGPVTDGYYDGGSFA